MEILKKYQITILLLLKYPMAAQTHGKGGSQIEGGLFYSSSGIGWNFCVGFLSYDWLKKVPIFLKSAIFHALS